MSGKADDGAAVLTADLNPTQHNGTAEQSVYRDKTRNFGLNCDADHQFSSPHRVVIGRNHVTR
jgi:hypothetical protein